MKRTSITKTTAEQALDETMFLELKTLIKKARRAFQKAAEAHMAVFEALEDMRVDIDVPSVAENADNLRDAISCYIQYGEFGLENLLSEIRKHYTSSPERETEEP